MERKITGIASFMGITAIILGAFGAHALKKQLSIDQLNSFEIGVKYQMYHALFLLLVANNFLISNKTKKAICLLVILGVIFFSGSLYIISTKTITGIDFKFVGAVTPIGGGILIAAWGVLFWRICKVKR